MHQKNWFYTHYPRSSDPTLAYEDVCICTLHVHYTYNVQVHQLFALELGRNFLRCDTLHNKYSLSPPIAGMLREFSPSFAPDMILNTCNKDIRNIFSVRKHKLLSVFSLKLLSKNKQQAKIALLISSSREV